jgi:hypothetical protein
MSSSWTDNPVTAKKTLKISKVHIHAFRAMDDPISSGRFAEGHAAVLSNHGIKKVSSSSTDWIQDPNVYVILASSPGGQKIYGGARIHIFTPATPLPLQKPFGKFDPRIHDIVARFADDGCAELCALWNSIEVAGFGIGSKLIIKCAVSMTERLHVKHLLALSSPVTRRWIPDFGFYTIEEIGDNGGIPYPTERLTATVAHFINPDRFKNMSQTMHDEVMALRKNPSLQTNASGPKGSISLHYDLEVTRRL